MPWIGKNHTGLKYGKWEVLERDLSQKRPMKYFCRCECGIEKSLYIQNLIRGLSTQCQNCQAKKKSENLIGTKHHFLTVLDNPKVNGKTKLLVLCECGNKHLIPRLSKGYKSCGKCGIAKIRAKNAVIKISGKKVGSLTILSKDNATKLYRCKCDCKKIIDIPRHKLLTQHPSCGCYWKKKNIENAKKLEGTTYHYLKVLKFLGMGEDKRAVYSVRCKCGNKFERSISYIFGSKSCGCLQKENAPKGEDNHLSKVTSVDVTTIRDLFKSGYYTRKDLSVMFGITYEHICMIIKKKAWKHV